MKTIFAIFKSDIRAIVKYFFVLVIVVALGTMPSLYAWINIYANWDPYVETGNLPVALASRDSGINLKNGTHVNNAEEVIADVKDDEDVAYTPLDDPEEAIEGVRSGRFYAAIVFEDGFTYDMHHFEEAIGDKEAKITYYTNVKKNATAIKMTDAISENLLDDINSKYLKEMLTKYFSDAGDVLDEVDTDDAVDTALAQLISTRDAIHDFNAAVGQLKSTKGDVTKSLKDARKNLKKARKDGSSDIAKAKAKIDDAKATIDDVKNSIESRTGELKTLISDLKKTAESLQGPLDEAEKQKLKEKALDDTDRILTILQDLRAMLPDDPQTTAGKAAADALDIMIKHTKNIKALLEKDPASPAILADLDTLKQMLEGDLVPSLKLMMTDIKKALERTKPMLKSVDGILDDVNPVLKSAESTVGSLDSSLTSLQAMLGPLETKLDDIIAQVQDAEDDDKADVLTKLLGNDAEQYSTLFTDFVEIETEQYFKPVAYGAAMTPFYTIIALWVGGVMLVTLMNCNVDRRKFPQITEAQGFFGRYLIFFLIGQIQAAVVVAGDIFLLHCQPVHPWLMWLSAAVTSMVFVALIYALTLAFGDIGRAAVVVIMMIQIAGSSGTFPIEILPPIFSKIYLFFPFPYAINAMREAICGLYQNDFVIYLAKLMVFFLAAVVVGVCIRKPFAGVKQFMYDKMRETEVM